MLPLVRWDWLIRFRSPKSVEIVTLVSERRREDLALGRRLVCQRDQRYLWLDEVAAGAGECLDLAISWRPKRDLHLHRLQDDERVTLTHGLSGLDQHPEHGGRHGGGETDGPSRTPVWGSGRS